MIINVYYPTTITFPVHTEASTHLGRPALIISLNVNYNIYTKFSFFISMKRFPLNTRNVSSVSRQSKPRREILTQPVSTADPIAMENNLLNEQSPLILRAFMHHVQVGKRMDRRDVFMHSELIVSSLLLSTT